MSFAALLVVVLASFLHATWNLLAKRAAAAGSSFVFAYCLVSSLAFAPWVAWLVARHAMVWSPLAVGCVLLSGWATD